jgi:hypothetical protein
MSSSINAVKYQVRILASYEAEGKKALFLEKWTFLREVLIFTQAVDSQVNYNWSKIVNDPPFNTLLEQLI